MKIKTRLTLGGSKEIQSMKGYIALSFLCYAITLIVLAIGANVVFPNAEINSMAFIVNVVAVFVAVGIGCYSFNKRHKRPMFYQEYISFLIGVIWTTLLLQIILSGIGLLSLLNGDPRLIETMLTGFVIGLALHVLVVWLLLRFTVIMFCKHYT